MQYLVSFVKGIVCYSILTAVLTELLPPKYYKYIRLYMGLLFLLLFLSPAVRLFHLEDRMEDFFYRENLKLELEDKSFELELKEQAVYEEIKDEYTRHLRGELSSFLEQRGYQLSSVELHWNEDTEHEDFGRLASLSLRAAPLGVSGEGMKVDRIKVEVFWQQEENMEEKALKNELANFYNIDADNINVSIQGGEGR